MVTPRDQQVGGQEISSGPQQRTARGCKHVVGYGHGEGEGAEKGLRGENLLSRSEVTR
jgi:hypothetical protein